MKIRSIVTLLSVLTAAAAVSWAHWETHRVVKAIPVAGIAVTLDGHPNVDIFIGSDGSHVTVDAEECYKDPDCSGLIDLLNKRHEGDTLELETQAPAGPST